MAITEYVPTHILDLLQSAAITNPDNGLLLLENGWSQPPTFVSYIDLYAEVQAKAAILLSTGVVQHRQVAITYFDNARDNILWLWAVVAAGGVCAVLNPISTESKTADGQLENVKELFGSVPVLTTQKLAPIFTTKDMNVRTIEKIQRSSSYGQRPVLPPQYSGDLDDIAVLLFTSGSTGHSKAVKFSHGQLIASVQAKSSYLSSRGLTFMSWISFDHSACFCEIHLQALFNGSNQVFVPHSELVIEPRRFFQLLSSYKVGYTFSPNFFLAAAVDSLNKTKDDFCIDLSHLSVIMCGGEANRSKTLKTTDEVLRRYGAPRNTIKAAYGLSETCSACFYNLETPDYDTQTGTLFASAGQPLPGAMEMMIVPAGEEERTTLATEGILYLRGPLMFKGYYNNTQATAACMTADGWMNTGDVARIDENGFLHLLGRQKEVLVLNGNNFSSFEIEHALESSSIAGLEISFTAVFSSWDEKRNSEAVVVLFNPTEAAIGPANLRKTLQAMDKCVLQVCQQKPLHIIPLPKSLLPKSTIGKLSRAKLRKSFEAGHFDDYIMKDTQNGSCSCTRHSLRLEDVPPTQQEIARIYSRTVDVPAQQLLGPDALMASGISSLGYIRLKSELERGLQLQQEIPMSVLLRSHSVAELEAEIDLLQITVQKYEPVVTLSATGSKQPLILLPPGGGEILCWTGLLEYLPDRPIYAIRSRGLQQGEEPFSDLQDMLACFYDGIRRVQPYGPYALLGYCFGGLLSFEIAKMLEAAGETVSFCGGLDNPPLLGRTMGEIQHRQLMIDILPVVTGLNEDEAAKFAEETSHLTDLEFYDAMFVRFPLEAVENMETTVSRIQAVEIGAREIVRRHVPQGEVSTMDVFCADPLPHFGATVEEWRGDILGEWKNYVREGKAVFRQIPGSHFSCMKKPLIVDFQRILNAALEEKGV